MSSGADEDFFNNMIGEPTNNATSAVRSRRVGPPPPPPRRAGSGGSSGSGGGGIPAGGTNEQGKKTAARTRPKTTLSRPSSSRPTTTTSSTAATSRRPPMGSAARPSPAASTSYYGTSISSSTAPAAPSPSAQPASSFPSASTAATTSMTSSTSSTPSYYNPAATTSSSTASTSLDWYTPSATTTAATSEPTIGSFPTNTMAANPAIPQQQQQQQYHQQVPSMMDPTAAGAQPSSVNTFTPNTFTPMSTTFMPTAPTMAGQMDGSGGGTKQSATTTARSSFYRQPSMDEDYANEPPLLEELGINIEHILLKTKAVVLPFSSMGNSMDPALVTQDADLAGPLAFCLLLGAELLVTGKIHFGYIYGFALFGCVAMTVVLNLISRTPISIWTVASILGYSLLPVNILALLKIPLVNLGRMETLGDILAWLTVAWSTTASTRLLEQGCGMRDQRYLVAYPIALLYSAFVLITIF